MIVDSENLVVCVKSHSFEKDLYIRDLYYGPLSDTNSSAVAITKIVGYLQNTKVFRMTKNNHIRKVEWFLDRIAQKLECLMLKFFF